MLTLVRSSPITSASAKMTLSPAFTLRSPMKTLKVHSLMTNTRTHKTKKLTSTKFTWAPCRTMLRRIIQFKRRYKLCHRVLTLVTPRLNMSSCSTQKLFLITQRAQFIVWLPSFNRVMTLRKPRTQPKTQETFIFTILIASALFRPSTFSRALCQQADLCACYSIVSSPRRSKIKLNNTLTFSRSSFSNASSHSQSQWWSRQQSASKVTLSPWIQFSQSIPWINLSCSMIKLCVKSTCNMLIQFRSLTLILRMCHKMRFNYLLISSCKLPTMKTTSSESSRACPMFKAHGLGCHSRICCSAQDNKSLVRALITISSMKNQSASYWPAKKILIYLVLSTPTTHSLMKSPTQYSSPMVTQIFLRIFSSRNHSSSEVNANLPIVNSQISPNHISALTLKIKNQMLRPTSCQTISFLSPQEHHTLIIAALPTVNSTT